MNWRDLLYFSKGERRALALLLCLITISWILLLWTDTKRMPIEAQTDAHRTENRQAPGERRIITGKNTSEGGKNFIRKESGPHPNKTKNTLKDKSPTLTGNNSYPTGKKRKGYTLYTRTEKYAPGTLVEQHRRHHDPEKSPWYRQHLRSADHEIQRTLRGLLRCQPVGGSVWDR